MNILKAALLTLLVIIIIISCQKEFTIEGSIASSAGSLKNDVNGNCQAIAVSGSFKAGKSLNDSNEIQVQVNVTVNGSFTISTDTVNGYYFTGVGTFADTGLNVVSIKGRGTPVAGGTDNFSISYNNTHCSFTIPVSSGGGTTPADFTLGVTGTACTGAVAQGTYTAGTVLTADNKITIQANVTAPGTYSISTTAINGITFSASGTFAAVGTQTVILTGSGTPSTAGNTNINVNAGSSTCTFTLSILPAAATNAVYTLDASAGNCSNADVQGNYVINTALGAANLVTLDVDVSTPGNWNVTTAAVNGITFSGSGTFVTAGSQTITLQGSGTPVTAGDNTIPVTAGSSCSFIISVGNDPSAPPCNPDNNTADLSGVNSIAFYAVSGAASGGSYTITGNGTGGDVTMEFFGAFQPSTGIYRIQSVAGDFSTGDVHVSFVATDIYWQSSEGSVYVTVANGKVTAVICNVAFTGSLGGPAFHTNANAKITEE